MAHVIPLLRDGLFRVINHISIIQFSIVYLQQNEHDQAEVMYQRATEGEETVRGR
jgi:hypothetical protein